MKPFLLECPACTWRVAAAAKQCPRCGQPIYLGSADGLNQLTGVTHLDLKSDTMALLSMIFGLGSIGMMFLPLEIAGLALMAALLAIAFSVVTFIQISTGRASGRGMAITGMLAGVISVGLFCLGLAVLVAGNVD